MCDDALASDVLLSTLYDDAFLLTHKVRMLWIGSLIVVLCFMLCLIGHGFMTMMLLEKVLLGLQTIILCGSMALGIFIWPCQMLLHLSYNM